MKTVFQEDLDDIMVDVERNENENRSYEFLCTAESLKELLEEFWTINVVENDLFKGHPIQEAGGRKALLQLFADLFV